MNLLTTDGWTPNQYLLFRGLLGLYVLIHFVQLLPWCTELFSAAGMLPTPELSPLMVISPNPLWLSDHPAVVVALTAGGALAGAGMVLGVQARWAALLGWLVLASLFTRNPLIANPAMPYVGWMLLAVALVPSPSRSDPSARAGWRLPVAVYTAAWIVLALSYSYSGYTKLLSPHWLSGDNVALVLQNPLARDWWFRDLLLALPSLGLQLLTWGILLLELLFAPLALSRRLRPWLWLGMLLVQLGFLLLLDFADLTSGMLLFHLLTLDPGWLKSRTGDPVRMVYYDGNCGFCHGFVRFVLDEDRSGAIHFRPLQDSPHADRGLSGDDSFLVETASGRLQDRSAALLSVLQTLGGLWRLLATVGSVLPRRLAAALYCAFGRRRHRLASRPDATCPLLPPELRSRVLH